MGNNMDSKTTVITPVKWIDLPVEILAQANRFIPFARANRITENPYPATHDEQAVEGRGAEYYLVYERVKDGVKETHSIDIDLQVNGPETANYDALYLRDFYSIDGPLDVVWNVWLDHINPRPPAPPWWANRNAQ